MWEATAFLFFHVRPMLHHVVQFYHRLCCEAIVEVVDDVLVGDVGDGCPCIEEALDVGSDRLALLLLAHA